KLRVHHAHVQPLARELRNPPGGLPLEEEEVAAIHDRARSRIVRRTRFFVSGSLYAFFARGRAPAIASSPAFAAVSSVMACPASARSTSGSRQGIGATPPRTTRASRQMGPSICSTTAALTTACVHASRSSTFAYTLRVPARAAGICTDVRISSFPRTFSAE